MFVASSCSVEGEVFIESLDCEMQLDCLLLCFKGVVCASLLQTSIPNLLIVRKMKSLIP